MTGRVFISYRRRDSSGFARAIYNELREQLGPDNIFMDVDTMEPGIDFVEAIEEAVGRCDILLALIGPQWLNGGDETSHRLDAENDYVRTEIVTALERDIRVIPVLVEGATMPLPDNLPEKLVPLTRRHAVEIRHSHFDADVAGLISFLVEQIKPKQEQTPPSHPADYAGEAIARDTASDIGDGAKPRWMWQVATLLLFVCFGFVCFLFIDYLPIRSSRGSMTVRSDDALLVASVTAALAFLITATAVRSGRRRWWVIMALGIPEFMVLGIIVLVWLVEFRIRGEGPLVCAIAVWCVGSLVIIGQALLQRRRLRKAPRPLQPN
jgi:hypothetical protein